MSASPSASAFMRWLTAASMAMGRPHARRVSPGHLLVAACLADAHHGRVGHGRDGARNGGSVGPNGHAQRRRHAGGVPNRLASTGMAWPVGFSNSSAALPARTTRSARAVISRWGHGLGNVAQVARSFQLGHEVARAAVVHGSQF